MEQIKSSLPESGVFFARRHKPVFDKHVFGSRLGHRSRHDFCGFTEFMSDLIHKNFLQRIGELSGHVGEACQANRLCPDEISKQSQKSSKNLSKSVRTVPAHAPYNNIKF